MSYTLNYCNTHTTLRDAILSPGGALEVVYVIMFPLPERAQAVWLPEECARILGASGAAWAPLVVRVLMKC